MIVDGLKMKELSFLSWLRYSSFISIEFSYMKILFEFYPWFVIRSCDLSFLRNLSIMLFVDVSSSSWIFYIIIDLSEFLAVCGSMLSIGVTSSKRHRFRSTFLAVLQPCDSSSFNYYLCFRSFLPNRLTVLYSGEGLTYSYESLLSRLLFLVD